MRMAYNGSHGSVDVPSLGLFGVERGTPVEVDASEATLRQMRRQGWRKVKENSNDDNGKGDA